MQGFACVSALFDAIVMMKEVNPVNYMPIELLTRENIDFYRRAQI
jgi:LacI family transcriptional regulator